MPHIPAPFSQTWQDSEHYAYTLELFATPWAWEYMRRNPKFQAAWNHAQGTMETVAVSERVTTLRTLSNECLLKPWRCLFSSEPHVWSADATVLWHPEHCPTVLRAVAVSRQESRHQALFLLSECPLNTTLLITPDGVQHVVLRDGAHWLQLAVTGASLAEPVQLAAELPSDPRLVRGQVWARQCFEDFRSTGRLLDAHFPPHSRARRMRECLQALDAEQAGASQREIAQAAFGSGKVDVEWNHPSERMRDWVRNAVRRGRALMDGHYQRLLCYPQR